MLLCHFLKNIGISQGYFDEVYSSLLVPAAAEAGVTAKTAKRSGSDIYNAQIVLADLTEHNPNVLFGLGFVIAFKKVALIRAKGTMYLDILLKK